MSSGTLVAPSLQSTGGVPVSVSGGVFHVFQVSGTVSLIIGVANVTINVPSEIAPYSSPSVNAPLSISVVDAT
jgi:hypothetical protein